MPGRFSLGSPGEPTANEQGLGMSVPWFPAVGAMIGLILGLFWIALNELVAPLSSSAITIMLGVVITGASHEDGFADTADSLADSVLSVVWKS